MLSTSLPLRADRRNKVRSSIRRRALLFRPTVESLEERSLLSTSIWTGGGAPNNSWTTAANWLANVAPSPGDDLLFPAGPTQLSAANNFAPGTTFHSITFSGGDYTLSGNQLALQAGIATTQPTGTNTISAPLQLDAPQTIMETYAGTTLTISGAVDTNGNLLTVDGTGNTSLSGIVSGAGGITKLGPGTLSLSATNTYGGLTTVNAGILAITGFGTPLGSASAGTTVDFGATLQTSGIVTAAEPLVLNGTGVGGGVYGSTIGAFTVATGFATWTGPITLASDVIIATGFTGNLTINTSPVALNGHTLTLNSAGTMTFNAAITDGVGGSGSLAVNPAVTAGTVNLTASNTYTGSTYVKAGTLNLSGLNGRIASTDIQLDANGSAIVSNLPGPAGILQLDNSAALNTDRLPDSATLTFAGGALSFVGRNAAVTTTETIGAMHLARGQSYVRSTQSTTTGATSLLTFGALARDPGTTVNFIGLNLGTATNRILFSAAPVTVGNSGGILPYGTFTPSSTGTPVPDFATYDAVLGIKQFTAYVTSLDAAGPGDTVKLENVSTTLTADKTINALLIRNTGTLNALTINPNVVLTLSNGLLTSGSGSATIQSGAGGGTPGTLSFDGGEGLITRFMQTNLNTVIAGSGGLVIGGLASVVNGVLINPPAPGNSYTGGTTINAGIVTIGNNNSPFGGVAGGAINHYGGVLQIANVLGLQPLTLPNALVLDNSNGGFWPAASLTMTFAGPISIAGRSTLALPGNTNVTFAGQVSGSGNLTVTAAGLFSGGGILNLTNAANNHTGGTTLVGQSIFLPTLTLGSAGALGSGPVTIASGTLQAASPGIAIGNPVSFLQAPASNTTTTFAGANPFSFAGPIDLLGSVTVTNNLAVSFAGNISGPGSITKAGTGVLVLSGASARTGATMLNGGTLLIDGSQPSSAIGVLSGTLGGIGVAGPIAVAAGQNVNPGDPATVTGILAATAADFSGGGLFRVQVTGFTGAGASYDRLNLGSGLATLGGTSRLVVDLAGVSTTGRADGVLLYGSRTGNFPMFSQVDVLNNPHSFIVVLQYTANALNLLIVDGPNDAPVNSVPGPQTTIEDTPLVFSTGNGNAISISDADAGIYPVEVTLGATHGTLTLSGTAGLTFNTGDGSADTSMDFTGSIADINTALAGLSFTPDLDYHGPAALSITTNDQGNLGTGGPAFATSSVAITVVDPVPVIDSLSAAPNPIDENGTTTLQGSFIDPAPLDTHTVLIDWGDGSPQTTLSLAVGMHSFSADHQYLDDDGPGTATTYHVTVTVSDDDGQSGSASTDVTVNNVAPAAVNLTVNPSTIDENGSTTVSGTFTDPGTLDTHTVVINWGDGSPNTTLNLAAGVLTFSAAHQYLDNLPGDAPFTITATVTDKDGGSGAGSALVTVQNVAPAAVSLSVDPSSIDENGSTTVSGTFTDPGTLDTHTVVINWGDGSPDTTLNLAANVLTFSATHQYLDNLPGDAPFTITATVTDKDGGSGAGNALVTVLNVAPAVSAITGPTGGVRGQELAFSANFTDAGTLDTHTAVWDWNDGTTSTGTVTEAGGSGTATASHVFTASGTYTVTLTITDKDGASTSVSTQVVIVAAQLQPDSADPTKTALLVGGTTGDDSIQLNPSSGGNIQVTINGVAQGDFGPTGRIIIFGQAGDDDIQLANSVPNDAWLYGGAGNDVLKGGGGNNVLFGGDGDDTLMGSAGRNLVIGGNGADTLKGLSSGDILIGGSTAWDANEAALLAIMAEWTSPADYVTRVSHLRGTLAGGANGGYLLNSSTVVDDNAADTLWGGGGMDWFFAGLGDEIKDQHAGELID
jgi:autotransporter-associated beta strand protein